MSMRCYGRRSVHAEDKQRSADIECWDDNGKIVFRTLIYNADMFLIYCNVFNNEDDAETYISDSFLPSKLVEDAIEYEA